MCVLYYILYLAKKLKYCIYNQCTNGFSIIKGSQILDSHKTRNTINESARKEKVSIMLTN